jgi:hypothetical protein
MQDVTIKRTERKHALTARADPICVGIAARLLDPGQLVQETVVCVVLADHQWGIVALRPIGVVNFSFGWERPPECAFSANNVEPLIPFAMCDAITLDSDGSRAMPAAISKRLAFHVARLLVCIL